MENVVVCGQSPTTRWVTAQLLGSSLRLNVWLDTPDGEALDMAGLRALSAMGDNRLHKGTAKSVAAADLLVMTDFAIGDPESVRAANLAGLRRVFNAVMSAGFSGQVVVAMQEVELMTYFAQRFSGLPKSAIIGTGTAAVTLVFEQFLAHALNVPMGKVTAYAVGTATNYVLLWSRAYIGTTPVLSLAKDDALVDLMEQAGAACADFAAAASEPVTARVCERLVQALAGAQILWPVTAVVPDGECAWSMPMRVDENGVTQLAAVSGTEQEKTALALITDALSASIATIESGDANES